MKRKLVFIVLLFVFFVISVDANTRRRPRQPVDINTLVSTGWDDTESKGVYKHGVTAGYSRRANVVVHEGYYSVNPKKLKEAFTLNFNNYFKRYLPNVKKVDESILYASAKYGWYLVEAKLEIISDDTYKLYVRSKATAKNEGWKNRLVQYLNKAVGTYK
jgi:hypothetical protein